MFLCIFTPVILAKANILWDPMDPAWINQSAVIGYTIGSVGMIAPVLALLIDRTNLTVNVFVIVGLSIVESILGFFPLGFFVLLARVVAMGIYVPYTLGFAASFIFVRKVGLFSGTIFSVIGIISAVLCAVVFTILRLIALTNEENQVKEIVLLVAVALMVVYPLLVYIVGKRTKSGVSNV